MRKVFLLIMAAFSLISLSEAQLQGVKVNKKSIREVGTRELVQLVKDGTGLVRVKGEAAFKDFRVAGSKWRKGEVYIFVLDPDGDMVVHQDPELEGKYQLGLKDITCPQACLLICSEGNVWHGDLFGWRRTLHRG